MAFDTKCHDLATAFLGDEPKLDTPENRDALAQIIQTAIEDWINYENTDSVAARRHAAG